MPPETVAPKQRNISACDSRSADAIPFSLPRVAADPQHRVEHCLRQHLAEGLHLLLGEALLVVLQQPHLPQNLLL